MKKTKLSFFEAAAIITGFGIGGGIMTVPYLASQTGLINMIILLLFTYFICLILHLIIAEIMLRDDESSQIAEVFEKYIFKGKSIFMIWILFIFIGFSLLSLLAAYIAGGGKIFNEIAEIPLALGNLIFYFAAAGVVFFGYP